MKYLIPVLILFVFIFGIIKKVKPYDTFIKGASKSAKTVLNLFPCLVAIFILTELFEVSGLSDLLIKFLKPVFSFLGIPSELSKLVLIKPFSGSGSLALLSDIYAKFGVDSYLARTASVIYGSSETVFYISAVYFATAKKRNLFLPIVISLIAGLFSQIFACLICKVM